MVLVSGGTEFSGCQGSVKGADGFSVAGCGGGEASAVVRVGVVDFVAVLAGLPRVHVSVFCKGLGSW